MISRPEFLPAAPPVTEETSLLDVRILRLDSISDARGMLVEMCRETWVEPDSPVQWNAITNRPGALRGMHWHLGHLDYLSVVHGALLAAVVDLRVGSPTEGAAELVELQADPPNALVIPAGIAHGFFSPAHSVVMYGVSAYWDPDDELGVRYDDPGLGIPWPRAAFEATVSERDR